VLLVKFAVFLCIKLEAYRGYYHHQNRVCGGETERQMVLAMWVTWVVPSLYTSKQKTGRSLHFQAWYGYSLNLHLVAGHSRIWTRYELYSIHIHHQNIHGFTDFASIKSVCTVVCTLYVLDYEDQVLSHDLEDVIGWHYKKNGKFNVKSA
jgi:hypothetical protein